MLRLVKCVTEYILSILRISIIFLTALFVPRVFIYYVATVSKAGNDNDRASSFKLGLENISPALLKNLLCAKKKSAVGLVTNHTGKDQVGNRNIDILVHKGLTIKAIFIPKHGFNADSAEHSIRKHAEYDVATNIPMVRWGGGNQAEEVRYRTLLNQVDILVFDIQDSGLRYGYATTLLQIMKTAGEYNKKVVVLDRPNVLGSSMEGALLTAVEAHGDLPIPMRHGMTAGELAHYFNKHVLQVPVALHVVPMQHYIRHEPRAISVAYNISPNITTLESCYGYSFLGLLGEVEPFDIGVGTERSFQCLMLPENHGVSKQQWYSLSEVLKKHGIESKYYRCFNKRKKRFYNGLKIHIQDINTFSSFNTLLAVGDFFKKSGIHLTFSDHFDKVIGTQKMRGFFEGTVERQELENVVNAELTSFFAKAMNSFIYKPLPHVVHV